MRNVIMQMELTLDGFATGPNGEMDWFTLDHEAWERRVDQYNSIDTVVLGRKNYLGFAGYWPARAIDPSATETDVRFSRWLDATPKVVFSRTLDKAEWQNSRLAKGDIAEGISKLKEQPGKDILIMSSISIGQACMQLGLLDEYWLTIHPVAIGSGIPLFKDRVKLNLLNTHVFSSGQVFVHYETQRT